MLDQRELAHPVIELVQLDAGPLRFDFQDDIYTLALNWRGSDIPSELPRKDLF